MNINKTSFVHAISTTRKTQPKNTMNTTHTKTAFGYSDARSKAVVWSAYADHFGGEEIMEEGFNINTGYVYIALENGITLASCFGQSVDFLIYDSETDEEIIFGSYEELLNHLNK